MMLTPSHNNFLMNKTCLKVLSYFLILTFFIEGYSQDFSSLWQAHYSYNDIVDVVEGNNKIYAAAQNAIFEYDSLSGELKTITTVEGLSALRPVFDPANATVTAGTSSALSDIFGVTISPEFLAKILISLSFC